MEAARKQTRLTDLFISYKRNCDDENLAIRLEGDLQGELVKVRRDKTGMAKGAQWDRWVEQNIDECRQFAVIMSPDAVVSDNVRNEIHRARRKNKPIIPLLHAECDRPVTIEGNDYVDFTGAYSDGFRDLLNWKEPPLVRRRRILRILKRPHILALIVLLVVIVVAAVYFLAPSSTELTVTGDDLLSRPQPDDPRGKIPVILVTVSNSGGRTATLTDEFLLSFPPDIAIHPQDLHLIEHTPRPIPGHTDREIRLVARGLEPITRPDGSSLTGAEAVKLLNGRRLTLNYRIGESSGDEMRSKQFDAVLIDTFIENKLPE